MRARASARRLALVLPATVLRHSVRTPDSSWRNGLPLLLLSACCSSAGKAAAAGGARLRPEKRSDALPLRSAAAAAFAAGACPLTYASFCAYSRCESLARFSSAARRASTSRLCFSSASSAALAAALRVACSRHAAVVLAADHDASEYSAASASSFFSASMMATAPFSISLRAIAISFWMRRSSSMNCAIMPPPAC